MAHTKAHRVSGIIVLCPWAESGLVLSRLLWGELVLSGEAWSSVQPMPSLGVTPAVFGLLSCPSSN